MVGIELELAIELICDSVKSINDIKGTHAVHDTHGCQEK